MKPLISSQRLSRVVLLDLMPRRATGEHVAERDVGPRCHSVPHPARVTGRGPAPPRLRSAELLSMAYHRSYPAETRMVSAAPLADAGRSFAGHFLRATPQRRERITDISMNGGPLI